MFLKDYFAEAAEAEAALAHSVPFSDLVRLFAHLIESSIIFGGDATRIVVVPPPLPPPRAKAKYFSRRRSTPFPGIKESGSESEIKTESE